jgi:selenocysteine lyase/cysteine desulfurase
MENIRMQFQPPEGIYLLNHSVGPLPAAALERQAEYFAAWRNQGGNAWDDWLGMIARFRSALPPLLGGIAEDYCPQVNISSAVSKLLPTLPQRAGRTKLLLSELDFPSMGFVVAQAEKLGYRIEWLKADDNKTFPLEAWQRALTDDTQLVVITHGLYGNSYLNPVAEILAAAQAKKILTLVDIAQTAGVVPIDVVKWNADFVVGSCVKWLCGGPGAGFLWVNPALSNTLEPLDVGWFSHENPFEFDIHHFKFAHGAARFWGGTPSVLPYVVATAGLELLADIGVENIRAHNQSLTGKLIAAAGERKIPVRTPADPARRGGTVVLDLPDPASMVKKLLADNIFTDMRPGFGVRFAPHIFNTEAEIDAVIERLPVL